MYLFLRRFERLVAQGESPTVALLADWGTTNSTVGELVDILKSHKLLAAASILLPDLKQNGIMIIPGYEINMKAYLCIISGKSRILKTYIIPIKTVFQLNQMSK